MNLEALKLQLEQERSARKKAEKELAESNTSLNKAVSKIQQLERQTNVDLSHSKCPEENLANKYVNLAESIEEFIYYADLKGHFIFMNQKGPEKFGYSFEDLSGKHFTEFVHLEDIETTKEFYKKMVLENRDQSYFEFRVMTKDRKIKWVGQSVTSIKENGVTIKFAAVARDITKIKKLHLELQQAKSLAEASQRAEKQFLTNMSHEIRTPLNAIIGMSHLIQETEMSTEQEEYIDILFSSAKILHALINDILDFSKIDSGNLEINEKEFDLVELIENFQKTFSVKLENKSVNFVCEVDPEIDSLIKSDELLLNQVLFNLIGNAEKFTDKGEIKLSLKVLEKTKSNYKIRFEISDSGIGISEEDQIKIFHQFVQVSEQRKYSYGGTGLGLPISRKILSLLGGSLKVKSKLNKGTTFYFELDLANTRKSLQTTKKSITKNDQFLEAEYPILVVEDNVMNRRYIKRLLNKWSLEFEFAVNGLEAVEKCNKNRYSLIFMDIQMPVMDGYEATATIRSECKINHKTPIIALTASSMISMKTKAFDLGMNDFLAKPFNPFQLAEVLRNYLNKAAHQDQKMDEVSGKFRFDGNLNCDFLYEAYGDDLDHAVDMFETFLEVIESEFQTLLDVANENDMVSAAKLSHKLKPLFTMVGLDKLTKDFEKLEKTAKENDSEKFNSMISNIDQEISNYVSLIKSETTRLQKHLC